MNNDLTREKAWLLREKYSGIESPEYFLDLKKLYNGEPVDYLIGYTPFLGCRIDLSERTLIPRTETEYWVSEAVNELRTATEKQPLRCLDIFSGSGCIGTAVLAQLPHTIVDFADIDEGAVRQIKKNLVLNNIDPVRYRVFQSNIFSDIPKGTYDVIFANPPYIAKENKYRVEESVLSHEPHHALFAANDGLLYIETLLKESKNWLNPGGRIYIEHDDMQKPDIERLIKKYAVQGTFHKDQFGSWRTVLIQI